MKRLLLKSVIAVIVTYVVLGFMVLPYYIKHELPKIVKKNFDIQTYIQRIDFNPFTFEVKLGGFILEDTKNKDLLFFETLYVDLELLDLFQNKIHLKHIKIDNFRVDIDLDKNKTPNFQYLLEKFQTKETKEKEESRQAKAAPSLQIDKLDLNYLNVLFTDNSKKEPYTLVTTPFDINLENISIDANHINNIQFVIDTKESGKVAIDSKLVVEPFKAEGNVKLTNININKKFDYLKTEDINFDLKSKRLNLDFGYKLEMPKEDMVLTVSDIALDIAKADLFKDKYAVTLDGIKSKVKQFDLHINKELSYKVDEIALDLSSVILNDKNINNTLTFNSFDLDVEGMTSKKDEPIKFTSSLKMPKSGALKVKGEAVQEPLSATADIKLQNTTLKPYEKYVQEFVNLGIDSFFVTLNSKLQYSVKNEKSDIRLNADATLEKIALTNTKQKQKVADVKKIDIKNIAYKNEFLNINSVTLHKPFVNVSFNKDKTTNFSNFAKEFKEVKEEEVKKEKSKFGFMVKKLTIKDGKADIADKTITPSFTTKEDKINITVNNLTLNPKVRTEINHKSVMDKYSPLSAKGKLKLEDPLDDLVVSLQLQNVDLPALSMYSGKFIGNKIANGKLSLDLNHTIKSGQLKSTNNIKIKDIELGEKVESKDAIDAPIGLAIALLEDSSGMIDLDIPMEGDVKSPKFDISDAISDVIVNTIVGIVTAPFKFLAILTGLSGDDDISNAGFAYGVSEIDPTQKEKLDSIAKALVERPQLQIKIKPAYSLENDKKVLHEQKFQATYPILSDTSKKFQELYNVIKEQFVKLYTDKEYEKLEGKEDEKYPYMIERLKETIEVELAEIETLAKNRAVAVENYLIEHGVNKKSIQIEDGYTTDKIDKKLNQVIVLFELDSK